MRKTLKKKKKKKRKKKERKKYDVYEGKSKRWEAVSREKQELTRPRREPRGAKAWDRTRVRRNLIYDRGRCKFHLAPRNSAETAQ